ncbi:MAG: hypothetical protein JWM44_773 [Bacilli bacterium]|nr:hypothetical protein [Bacilli bacterium]
MNQLYYKRLISFALVMILTFSVGIPIHADDGTAVAVPAPAAEVETIANTNPIGSVAINNQSFFELKQLAILPGDEDKTVTFVVTVKNGDDKELQFIDYWLRLNNSAGAQFTLNLLPDDKDKNRVPAHSSVDFHFYAKVNLTTNLKDLRFSFIQWDFSAVNYEKKLGDIAIPETYSDVTPIQSKQIISVPGTSLKTAVSRVEMNQNEDNYAVTLYYSMENIGLKSTKLPAYTYAVYTSEGIVYPVDTAGAAELTIAPRIKKELQMNVTIPKSVDPKDWKLVITKEDATLKLSLPVAAYLLPQSTTDDSVTAATRKIEISSTPVNTGIVRASISKTETNYLTNIFFSFSNNGTKAVVLPNYLFTVTNKEGLTYPMAAPELKDISLNPKESKEIQLSVSIPIAVSTDNLELKLIQPAAAGTDSSFSYPIASYKVPKSSAQDVSIGAEYPFIDKNGTYSAMLNTIQRLPWDDQDILSAEISLGNKGASSVSLPDIQGYFLLDGNIKVEASLIKMDNIISLPASSSASYILMSKVPYTSQFKDLRLILEEKAADKNITTIAEFNDNADLLTLPIVAKGESYKLQNIGKSSEVKITNVLTYSGTTNDLYYLEIEMKNMEKRYTTASKLAGYLKTQDDLYFPATVSDVTQKISPSGKAVLAVWSELPKGLKVENLDLMLGLAVQSSSAPVTTSDSTSSASSSSNDGYYRVADMKLPDAVTTSNSSLDNLIIQPYTMGLTNAKTSDVSSSGFSFKFDYTLAKNTNPSPDAATNVHKLVVEITDSSAHKYENIFALDQPAGTASGLTTGSGSQSFQYTFSSQTSGIDFINSISRSRDYTLKIYDEFKGYRRLLASTTKSWFGNN